MHKESTRPDSLLHPDITDNRLQQAVILVIEDNALSQRQMLGTLHRHGFHAAEGASGGREALEKLATLDPDLIILDLLMPTMDGFALCLEFRKIRKLRNIPILVHTALENEQARLSIFRMGASDLVRKPVNDEELIARCRIHLEKRYILKDMEEYQERMEADLAHARAMQNMLMPDPHAIACVEKAFGLDIRALFKPSFIIGGDLWGMRPLPCGEKLALYIGDFTGHGVTAAINVFRLCTLIDKLPPAVLAHPAECLTQLNQQLFNLLPIELFATMFYAVLDTRQDSLSYCVAGSPPPLLLQRDGGFETLKGSGLPLAAIRTPRYREELVACRPGDALLLYSDALIETPNAEGALLDIRSIGELLTTLPSEHRTADALMQATRYRLDSFTSHGVRDDLTLNIYVRKTG